jgi:hypothetical protein
MFNRSEHTSFDRLKFPKTIFKYRNVGNDQHWTILTDQVVFFAPPSSFEDKLDCKIPTRYDLLTDEEIYTMYYKLIKAENPQWEEFYLRQQATIWSNKGLMKNTEMQKEWEAGYFKDLDERLGVLCLTANCTNLDMWQKYSNHFNGFCVGFDPILMFRLFGGGGLVDYFEEIPIIKPTDSMEVKMITSVYSKLKIWAFEQEYRTQIFNYSPLSTEQRRKRIPNTAFKELIVGHNVSKEKTIDLVQWAKFINPCVLIFKTEVNDNGVNLVLNNDPI